MEVSMVINTIFNKQNIKNALFIIGGCLISAVGVNMFLINARLFGSGLSGIAILVQYALNFPAGYTVLIGNIPLLLLSYNKLNKRFTIYSTLGTLSLSIFLVLTQHLTSIISVHDTLLLCVYGGILTGAGHGIAYANHGSEGGMDIVVMLVKKNYDSFNVGQLGFFVNCVIVFIGMLLNGITPALYTLMSIYIAGVITDKMIHGLSRKKVLLIITDKEQEVCNYIAEYKYHGVTILEGKALTGNERNLIYCIVHISRLPALKFGVQQIDNNVLISILDASEVDGRGFNTSIL
jgi:uncharacterized membrane-anchored protein YitT (DUF2179 family)